MTEAEKCEAVAALLEIWKQIDQTPASDSHELLRLAALATWQLNRITAK